MDNRIPRIVPGSQHRDTAEGRRKIAAELLALLEHEDRRTRHDSAERSRTAEELRPVREMAARLGARDPFAESAHAG